jgi:hypothetical protein
MICPEINLIWPAIEILRLRRQGAKKNSVTAELEPAKA